MKLQCSCGAKYAFDVTPDMAQNPVRFICPSCGLDSSEFVNSLVRQELGLSAPAAAHAAPPAAPGQPAAQATPRPAPVARVRIHTPEPAPAEAAPSDADEPPRCPKHPDQFVTDKCYICSKPICPKCMELFGYLCSPLCKGKAEAHGIKVPVFAGQKSVREARKWRRVGIAAGVAGGFVLVLLGVWFWWAWFGSVPKTYWAVRFPDRSYSGSTAFCGKDQIVFLHGDQLARYDMKKNEQVWSRRLVDPKEIDALVAREMKDMQAIIDKANSDNPDFAPKMPDPEKLKKNAQRAAEEALELIVRDQNIWVLSPGKLTRYDRDTGKPVKELAVPAGYGGLIPRGDELLDVDLETGKPVVTCINLNTCESRTEQLSPPPSLAAGAGDTNAPGATPGNGALLAGLLGPNKAGLPVGTPGQDRGKVMDPKKVAEQAQHLSYAARIALPAILANSMNQERTLAAYDDQPARQNSPPAPKAEPEQTFSLYPTKDGFIQFGVKLLEERITTRTAMKAAPTKSVLDGNLTVAKTGELANEMLNQMQRDRGGAVVREDESRYQVTIRRLDSTGSWTGEVIGPPELFPLTTVNVLTANKSVMVFDKSDKKLWQAPLSYNVSAGYTALDPEHAPYGLGPCVEHKGTLYVIDEGVLTAFDLEKGTVRWRLPSVGIAGLFFDDQGMIYLNTTTASPDTLKYSNQIDVNRKDSDVVMKLDPRTGKVLWQSDVGGMISYVSGPYIYAAHSYQADNDDDSSPYTMDSVMGKESNLSIERLNPKNGHVMWEHCQKRAPLDIEFDHNFIRLVFRKEVQVLHFLTM